MARQSGIIKIEGRIGDIAFYKSKNGFLAREKGGISADRIANDPTFKRTRENGQEFGHVARSSKVLRNSIQRLLKGTQDYRTIPRLTQKLYEILKTDTVNFRGERSIFSGDLSLLKGFNFSSKSSLEATVLKPLETEINRQTGVCSLSIPALLTGVELVAPEAATHFKWQLGVTVFNGQMQEANTSIEESNTLALSADLAPLQLTTTINLPGTDPVLVVVGIAFFQQVNNRNYPLSGGNSNFLTIVEVSL